MMTRLLKNILPHVIAVAIFVVVALVYCRPALQGKVLNQSDIMYWKAMAQQSFKYKEAHGNFPLWTNSMFCGMPAYFIAMEAPNPIGPVYLHNAVMWLLPKPISFFVLLCIGFYILSQVLNIRYYIGILGAMAYAYASYSNIIIAVGHETKVLAMAYAPMLLAGILLVFKKQYLTGAAVTMLCASLLFMQNHLQINYYYCLTALIMAIAYAVRWVRTRQYAHIVKSFAITGACVAVGICVSMVTMATAYDYSKATRQGELNMNDSTKTTAAQSAGYSVGYAFRWSYGVAETYTFLIPNIYGGASTADLKPDAHLIQALLKYKVIKKEEVNDYTKNWPMYWGQQPSTSGPVYFGVVVIVLSILYVLYGKGIDKWWIIATCILGILMGLGKNAEWFNVPLFNYLPMYNKFRAPSMSLVLPQLMLPLMAALALQKLLVEKRIAIARTQVMVGAAAMAVILGFALYLNNSFSYQMPVDTEFVKYFNGVTNNPKTSDALFDAFKQDRKDLFTSDLIRATLLTAACLLILFAAVQWRIKPVYATAALLLLTMGDLLPTGTRYLGDSNYVAAGSYDKTNYTPTAANLQILKDTGFFRVLDNVDYSDARTYYYHNSMQGYSPVILTCMQDLQRHQENNPQLANMLNVRYIIKPDSTNKPVAVRNTNAMGNCWLVKHVAYATTPVQAMKAMNNFNPRDTAIVETAFAAGITAQPQYDSTAAIQFIHNYNDSALYHFKANTPQFAVFSEVYYNSGWKAYANNIEIPIVKTNYALRGLMLPAGNYDVRFVFKPASYYNSVKVAIAASAIVWVIVLWAIWVGVKRKLADDRMKTAVHG